jgi:hypothetical protein
MALISWAWTNSAPPGANYAADSTTLFSGAWELDRAVGHPQCRPFLRKFAMKSRSVHDDFSRRPRRRFLLLRVSSIS